jgi:hypothetical protein
MDEQRFDRITRSLARTPWTRRNFFGFVGGMAAGGLAAVGLGEQARWSRALAAADSEEQSVMLFEKLARLYQEHDGACEELRDKVRGLRDDNRELLDQVSTEQAGWSDEQRASHADTYGDRRDDAVSKILAGMQRCEIVDDAARYERRVTGISIGAVAATPAASPDATPAAALHGSHAFAQSGGTCATDVEIACYQPAKKFASSPWRGKATCTEFPFACDACDTTPADCHTKFPEMCADPTLEPTLACDVWAYFTADSCFSDVQAACYKPGGAQIQVPGSEFSAKANCVASGNCTVCDVPDSYCSDNYPGYCETAVDCYVAVDTLHSCTTFVDAACVAYKPDNSLLWRSEVLVAPANCTDGPASCTFCLSNDVCATNYPDNCVSDGENICVLTEFYTPPPSSCCTDLCPMPTGTCIGEAFYGALLGDGGATCMGCLIIGCGSTSHCLSSCKQNNCCQHACTTVSTRYAYNPAWSEGRTSGTPVPVGTPGTPAVTPTTTGTPSATGTSAPPPTVALPTQPPPTVALPTQPPATPGTPSSASVTSRRFLRRRHQD